MTRAVKFAFTGAAIIGFVLGAVYGCYTAKEASDLMQSAEIISISSVPSYFALQQFEHADSAHARQAVLLEIKILGQLERAAPDPSSEGKFGLAYTRLAMIEEAAGQAEAERRALDQARERFERAYPRKGLTDEQMKSTLKLLDESSDRL
jgi:hypothetical protein